MYFGYTPNRRYLVTRARTGQRFYAGEDQRQSKLNRTTEHSYTQAASCESAASEFSAVLRASTAAVTSGV
jgi:hypothetical protein